MLTGFRSVRTAPGWLRPGALHSPTRMPGSLFELNCHGCGAAHPISTGESTCWNHGERWSYEQWVCPKCQLLKSRATDFCCGEDELVCESCGSELIRWT